MHLKGKTLANSILLHIFKVICKCFSLFYSLFLSLLNFKDNQINVNIKGNLCKDSDDLKKKIT